MENATNALMIAGGIVIGVIVLSLFVFLSSTMAEQAKNFEENIYETDVAKFNNVFQKYIDDEKITSHELLSLHNTIVNINKNAGFEVVKAIGMPEQKMKNESEFLSNTMTYKIPYESITYSQNTSKIMSFEIKENR